MKRWVCSLFEKPKLFGCLTLGYGQGIQGKAKSQGQMLTVQYEDH